MRSVSKRMYRPGRLAAWVFVGLACAPLAARAQELSWSAFGTIGYARSDQPYRYERFIDNDGTIKRDSVLGVQVDAKLTNEIGATVQLKLAADNGSDRRYEAEATWAFLSYRPDNDWLFRVGKQRVPLYLYSETLDVGATYDFVRLPTEMYSLLPNNEGYAVSARRSLRLGDGDLTIDAYAGGYTEDVRIYLRDGVPGGQDAGSTFQKLAFRGGGLVLDYRIGDDRFRLSANRVNIRSADKSPLPRTFPFVSVAPGLGYYQVSDALPGPGVPTASSFINTTITVGADIALPLGAEVLGEFARSLTSGTKIGPQGNRGYLSLLEHIGKWTPYTTYAFVRSPQDQRDLYAAVEHAGLPPFVPGAASVNAAQRLGSDNVLVFHQSSWAAGLSYSFSATSKLKGEFLRTHVYDVSKFVDSPADETIAHRSFNVYSVAYSVVFE
jgi:hypothetical protein